MIEIRQLTKRFGSLTAVDKLDLSIGPGELFGFIGPNGAGKSTTMKILACLLRPDSGSATVDGHSVYKHGDAIRATIGYMPDFLGVYDDLTVEEYLRFFAAALRIPAKKRTGLVGEVLDLTDLGGKRHAMVSGLSRGMTQRLQVARVLLHDPKVLLLDEPASGLDPRARIEMRALLTELRRMGKTLMVSSHILSELGEMSTSIGIIEQGKLIYSGTMADALERSRVGERVEIVLERGGPANGDGQADHAALCSRVASQLAAHERVTAAEVTDPADGRILVTTAASGAGHHWLIEAVIGAGGRIAAFEPKSVNLEEAFLHLTKGAVQ